MPTSSLGDVNGVRPPVGSVLVRTDAVSRRRPLRVDQVNGWGLLMDTGRDFLGPSPPRKFRNRAERTRQLASGSYQAADRTPAITEVDR